MPGPIVVIGSSNVDLIMKMDRLPRKGETIVANTFVQTFGGKGANQAVGAGRAGGEVQFVSCIGDDPFIDTMLENFRQDRIGVDHVFRETGLTSGMALVMIDGDGNNYLSIVSAANFRLFPEHIDKLRGLLGEAAMVVLQCEIPPDTLTHCIDLSAELGRKVMLNLAPARPVDTASLKKLYLLAVNEIEAEYLCGQPVAAPAQWQPAAETLLARGPQIVVITLGVNGSYLTTRDGHEHIPAFKVNAVDSTAAGDVYCGSLAVALVEGKSLAESARFASAAAAISVTRLGAQPSAPTRSEIEAFMAHMRGKL